jgi:single-stranded DNA-specific DHH superfamily exonuclease
MPVEDIILSEKEIKKIRKILESSKNPLILFDDDADGLSSFLLIYRYMKEGKGAIIKKFPYISKDYLRKVEELNPDLIIILDLAKVSEEFIEGTNKQILWIDHHEPQNPSQCNVMYFNPRNKGDGKEHIPVSYMCYQIVQQDLWIAMAGFVGDWFLYPLKEKFIERYPDLLLKDAETPPQALFGSQIGKISKIFNFLLKGTVKDAMKYTKILTRIKSPNEILKGETPQGKKILKEFEKKNIEYEQLRDNALEQVREDDPVLLFNYPSSKNSFTSELSNELLFHYPKKVIIIARENNGEMKCSLRSSGDIFVSEILRKALQEVRGHGGGHDYACGACIEKDDFDRFLEIVREEIKN